MSQYQLLNNIKHKDLKILTRRSIELGDGVGGCVVYPTEFNELQKYYPILFQRQGDDTWLLITLFGFETNENLFLDGDRWRVPYVPAVIEREPFVIGLQQREGQEAEPVVHVDLASPRISSDGSGEPVFLEYGGNTPFLNRITDVLTVIHEGITEAERMISAFSALGLIEPVTLEIEFVNATLYKTSRYATINKEKLLTLSDEHLGQLHRNGLLRYAYFIVGSMTNIQHLVEYKNNKLRQDNA
jgi:hypothetical protein